MKENITEISTANNTREVHLRYIIGILVGLLIITVTKQWTPADKFTEYLSNAATLTSLVLGVVAIFYSMVSNKDLSHSLGSMDKASTDISETRNQISLFLTQSERINETGQQLSASVEKQVLSLQQTLSLVAERTSSLHGIVGQLPERFDKLESKMVEATSTMNKAPQIKSSENQSQEANLATSKLAQSFVNQGSVSGNLSLYACILALDSNKLFQIPDITEITGGNPDYVFGYLVSSSCSGFFDYKSIKDAPRTIQILSINKTFREAIEKIVSKKAASTDEKSTSFTKRAEKIRTHFQNTLPQKTGD